MCYKQWSKCNEKFSGCESTPYFVVDVPECKVWRNPLNLFRGAEYQRFYWATNKEPLTYYDMNLSAQDHQTFFTCESDCGRAEYESEYSSHFAVKVYCFWQLKSYGMWRCVVGWVVPHIFKNSCAFDFIVNQPKKVKSLPSFEMLEAAGPMTEWHIKENWNIQYCVCFCKYSRAAVIRTLVIRISLVLWVNVLRTQQN